jgi:hypothetical protein
MEDGGRRTEDGGWKERGSGGDGSAEVMGIRGGIRVMEK